MNSNSFLVATEVLSVLAIDLSCIIP